MLSWGGEVLAAKDSYSWFGNCLLQNDIFRVNTILHGYNKVIANEIPKGIKGVVLHGLYCFK
eukprot:10001252-Ditylum_brightwellii.AAC.1